MRLIFRLRHPSSSVAGRNHPVEVASRVSPVVICPWGSWATKNAVS